MVPATATAIRVGHVHQASLGIGEYEIGVAGAIVGRLLLVAGTGTRQTHTTAESPIRLRRLGLTQEPRDSFPGVTALHGHETDLGSGHQLPSRSRRARATLRRSWASYLRRRITTSATASGHPSKFSLGSAGRSSAIRSCRTWGVDGPGWN